MRARRPGVLSARAAGAALAAGLLLAPGARAHPGHQGERIVIDRISPPVRGVDVRTVPGAVGKLALRTAGRTTVTVLGSRGQPLMRVGPRGVQANRSAPEWFRDNEPLGIARVPPGAGPHTRARWARVSAGRAWEWFDHRLHPPGRIVTRWSVPILTGGRRAAIRGHVERVPVSARPMLDAPFAREGVEVAVVQGPTPSLQVRATGGAAVTVMGAGGEPFARVDRTGARVNVRSPVWVPAAQYRNRDLLGVAVDARARPRWERIGDAPQLIWPDPRVIPRVSGRGALRRVARWAIPVVVGGRRTTIRGRTLVERARPVTGESAVRPPVPARSGGGGDRDWPRVLLAALTLAVLAAGAVLVRRRR